MSLTINEVTKDIQITKGDTQTLTFLGEDNLPYEFETSDSLVLTVKKDIKDTTEIPVAQIISLPDVTKNITIEIPGTATENVALDIYEYNIQLINGTKINTLIPETDNTCYTPKFKVCEGVGKNEISSI